jgi:hypothetical protein
VAAVNFRYAGDHGTSLKSPHTITAGGYRTPVAVAAAAAAAAAIAAVGSKCATKAPRAAVSSVAWCLRRSENSGLALRWVTAT